MEHADGTPRADARAAELAEIEAELEAEERRGAAGALALTRPAVAIGV